MLVSITALRVEDSALANAGFALVGIKGRVGRLSWHTSLKVGRGTLEGEPLDELGLEC